MAKPIYIDDIDDNFDLPNPSDSGFIPRGCVIYNSESYNKTVSRLLDYIENLKGIYEITPEIDNTIRDWFANMFANIDIDKSYDPKTPVVSIESLFE